MTPQSSQLSDETLDLLFEITRDAPRNQLESVEAMDGKMAQVFAAGSVVIGLAAVGALTKHTTPLPMHYYTALLIATAAYLVLAAAAAMALWVREFFTSWGADLSWQIYWNATPRQIKHSLVKSIADDYRKNRPALRWKRWTVRVATLALAVESLAVGSALLISLR